MTGRAEITEAMKGVAHDAYNRGQIDLLDSLIETWDVIVEMLTALGQPTDPKTILATTRTVLVRRYDKTNTLGDHIE